MSQTPDRGIRIGYIDGQPQRVNERVVDGQWIDYLGQYAELVRISPFQIYKLFGGTVIEWLKRFPESLMQLSERLDELSRKYNISMLYMNLPSVAPYLLMARSYGGIQLGMVMIAHSVGSEFWLRQWTAIAPWLCERDVLLSSTDSSREALLRISGRYHAAQRIPLCIDIDKQSGPIPRKQGNQLLSIGRIEDVKNIEILLEAFADLRKFIADAQLTIAGEYTGISADQIDAYRRRIETLILQLGLSESVAFPGPVTGSAKHELFKNADLLLNLSTDPGETFGYNLIEAKTWGLPVICTGWNGFKEVVTDELDGYLIECRWEGDYPEIERKQVVARCLDLLKNPIRYEVFTSRALLEARQYDFKLVMPRIAAEIRAADTFKISADPKALQIASSPVFNLGSYLNLNNLRSVPFLHECLVEVANGGSRMGVREWMPLVKPVIGHFAGGRVHANL